MVDKSPRSVFVVDDDEDVAALFEALVDTRPGYEVAGAFAEGAAGVAAAAELRPDVAVVGAHRGTFDPLEVIRGLRASDESICVVLLADVADPITLIDALGAGAATVLSSGSGWSELMPTLDRLTGGATGAVGTSAAL